MKKTYSYLTLGIIKYVEFNCSNSLCHEERNIYKKGKIYKNIIIIIIETD